MSVESAVLGLAFNVDNWAKWKLVCDLNYPAVTMEKDVVYSQKNPTVCKADLLYNKSSKKYAKYPVVLNIHGGGWIIGDKTNSTGMCLQMADGGAFVVNMNYGMPPKRTNPLFDVNDPGSSHSSDYLWPYPIVNAYDALQWIVDNAEKYNLDLNNVFVSGDSAGAHLAAVTATASANPEYAKALGVAEQPPCKLKGAVICCGFYNLDSFWGLDMKKVPIARSMLQELVGNSDPTQVPNYKFVNPIPYFTKEMPRTLIVSGTMDAMTHGQSDMVEEKMKQVGAFCERYNSNGPLSLHDYQILSFTIESHNCMRRISQFVDETVAL